MAIVTFDDHDVQRAWELFQVYLPLLFNTETGIIGWIPCEYFEGGTEELVLLVLEMIQHGIDHLFFVNTHQSK